MDFLLVDPPGAFSYGSLPLLEDEDQSLSDSNHSPASSVLSPASSSTASSPDYSSAPYSPAQLPDLAFEQETLDDDLLKKKSEHAGAKQTKGHQSENEESGGDTGITGKKRGRKKTSTLTDEEKRIRAKESAARYRRKKNATNQQLSEKVENQSKHISALEVENKVLKEQVNYFQKLLQQMGIPGLADLELPGPAAGAALFALFSFFLVFSPWSPKKAYTPTPTNRQLLHDAGDALPDPHLSLMLTAVSSLVAVAFSLRVLLRHVTSPP
eukprot:g68988.t1